MKNGFWIFTLLLLQLPGLFAQQSIILDSPEYPEDYVRYFGKIYEPKEKTALSDVESYTIPGVSAFIWRHGCTPTAVGMLMYYYSQTGYPDFIANPAVPYDSIASDQHYLDYSLPRDSESNILPDKSETGGAHANNCVADFLSTSFSRRHLSYGGTWTSEIIRGSIQFMRSRYTNIEVAQDELYIGSRTYAEVYERCKAHIRANHPVILSVDSRGDGSADHSVLMIGYIHNKDAQTRDYIAYNTWDKNMHTYSFIPINTSTPFSIRNAYVVVPQTIIPRTPVYRFHRTDIGSYFFTGSEEEKNSLLSVPQWEFEGISHYVYAGTGSTGIVPVYRFLNSLGSHFYTASEGERDAVVQNLSAVYHLEGIAFFVLAGSLDGAKPVYRFFQPATASHYFTISEEDKANRIAYDPSMVYEGVAWYGFESE